MNLTNLLSHSSCDPSYNGLLGLSIPFPPRYFNTLMSELNLP